MSDRKFRWSVSKPDDVSMKSRGDSRLVQRSVSVEQQATTTTTTDRNNNNYNDNRCRLDTSTLFYVCRLSMNKLVN